LFALFLIPFGRLRNRGEGLGLPFSQNGRRGWGMRSNVLSV